MEARRYEIRVSSRPGDTAGVVATFATEAEGRAEFACRVASVRSVWNGSAYYDAPAYVSVWLDERKRRVRRGRETWEWVRTLDVKFSK
jgi:hypothetical protein